MTAALRATDRTCIAAARSGEGPVPDHPTPPRPIGGFFPLDLGHADRPTLSVAARWFGGTRHRGYRNARSALVRGLLPIAAGLGTLWTPAFLCPAVTAALGEAGVRVATYPLAPAGPVSPDLAFLRARAVPGDAILVVCAFGHPPAGDLIRFAATRRDLLWIEDRAAAAWPGAPWGDALLYSPRKILGVPDGGFLVLPDDRLPLPEEEPPAPATPARFLPSLLRHEDPAETDNATWFAAHRAREAAERVRSGPASRLTATLLSRLDLPTIAARRAGNRAALLYALPPALRTFAAETGDHAPGAIPHAVPVLLDDAPAVARRLAEARIFCPTPWTATVGTPDCPRARALAPRLLLLPCDHRYGPADMARVADALRAARA